jgi:hypothetical protein
VISENPTGGWSIVATPDNQQERLSDYLSGYVDGEGSFHVAVQRNPSTRFGWQLVPEFHVSQDRHRASVLHLLQAHLGCGYIKANAKRGSRDQCLVLVVRKRTDLIVRRMERREHLFEEGFFRLLNDAVLMNGGGKYRKEDWSRRILRGHMPNTDLDP